MKRFTKSKEMGIFLIVIFISLLISLNSSTFFRIDNLLDLLKGNAVLAIMAMGMLLVVITGGIDVSVGAIIAAVTILVGKFMVAVTGNVFIAFVVGSLFGIAFGAINGLLVAKIKIPPIVVTLGTVSVINGAMLYLTNGNWINDIPKEFIDFGTITFFKFTSKDFGEVGIPIQALFLVGAALLTWFILRYTLIGRGVYALGGNSVSAARIGYNLDKINIFVYAYMGLMAGIAGVVHTSIMKQVDPNAFTGFELQVVAAVVLGGANILGGTGSVKGTLLGVLLLAILNNGLILMHIPIFWQKIVVGAVIVIAVSIDVVQKNISERKLTKVDIE